MGKCRTTSLSSVRTPAQQTGQPVKVAQVVPHGGIGRLRAAAHAVRAAVRLRRACPSWVPREVPRNPAGRARASSPGGRTPAGLPRLLGGAPGGPGGVARTATFEDKLCSPGETEDGTGRKAAADVPGALGAAAGEPDAPKVRELLRMLEPGQALGGLSEFAKAGGDESLCRRLLAKHDGDMRKCREKFKGALRWRERHQELIETRKFRVASDCRLIGFDLGRHPVSYLCMANTMLPGMPAVYHLIAQNLRAVDLMPPGVETHVQIWDVHGVRVSEHLSVAPMIAMATAMEGYFAERLHEMVVIDLPRAAELLKNMAWTYVPEKTRRKIRFLKAAEAQEHFQRTCSPEVAGRLLAAMRQNREPGPALADRRALWMQVNTDGELEPAFS